MNRRFGTGELIEKIDTVEPVLPDEYPSLLRLSEKAKNVTVYDGKIVPFFSQL
jgi:hypothetical protein